MLFKPELRRLSAASLESLSVLQMAPENWREVIQDSFKKTGRVNMVQASLSSFELPTQRTSKKSVSRPVVQRLPHHLFRSAP